MLKKIIPFLLLGLNLSAQENSGLLSRQNQTLKERYRLTVQNILSPEGYRWNERGGLQMSGTNVGGGLMGSAYKALCSNQVTILQDAVQKAVDEWDETGNPTASNRILMQGMIAAAQITSPATTYTQMALLRGLELFSSLKADDALQSFEKAEFLNVTMAQYIQEVIILKAYTMDRDVIAPWLNRREQLHTDVSQMELQYVEFAKAQLNFVQTRFAGKSQNDREVLIYPLGISAKEYLKAIELVSLYAAYDLNNSLWRDRFTCTTENLIYINSDLRQFNQGRVLGGLRYKLERIYTLMERILIQLGQRNGCWNPNSN